MIYLDYAANHPVDPVVLTHFCEVEQRCCGNPNASHPAGQAAKQQMARTTEAIAALLGVRPTEVLYTSGATESNNLALKGIALAGGRRSGHILTTPLEHSSVSGSLEALRQQGFTVDRLDILPDGTLDIAQLRARLREDTVLVAISAVSSELGTIQPVEQVADMLRAFPHCRLHVDAAQAVGRIPLSFAGVDTVSIAPHKFGGLNGSGLLIKREGLALELLLHGGESASAYRSGTPAVALAAAAEVALRLALENREVRFARVRALHDRLLEGLRRYPKVRINSSDCAVPHILNLSIAGVKGTRFQQALAGQGVCVSVKSACASDGQPSEAVLAISCDRRNALSSWRISLSHLTTEQEIEAFLQIFDVCYHTLAEKNP